MMPGHSDLQTSVADIPASTRTLRLGHSPDPDDAFMWWPLANFVGPDGTRYRPQIDTGGYEFIHVLEDIDTLNQRCESKQADRRLEITALSIHQYAYVADRYVLTNCGSSMGDGYGPMLVTRGGRMGGNVAGAGSLVDFLRSGAANRPTRIAIPGWRTTAFLTLQLMLGEEGVRGEGRGVRGEGRGARGEGASAIQYEIVPFDQIIQKVASGEFDAGLIIHEGQLTYADAGLECIVDVGEWWTRTRGLPLPLGGNAIRRDVARGVPLGDPSGDDSATAGGEIAGILDASIRYALDHRDQAVAFALNYARDMGAALADEFVGMYVNEWTLDYGERGREAVRRLLCDAAAAGLTPALPDGGDIDFI